LLGVTRGGGASNSGTLFKLGTDGTGYAVLKEFSGSDGAIPNSQLLLDGNTLFGTTEQGGFYGDGVVFRLNLSPPASGLSPESQTAETGSAVEVTAKLSGFPKPAFQWYFNGTNLIPGATEPILRLYGVKAKDSGVYYLVARNELGACTNYAAISVIPAVQQTRILGVHVSGQPGKTMRLESAEDLSVSPFWGPMAEWTLTNTSGFYIDSSPTYGQRFYRAWQPWPSPAPSISLERLPAITLSGPIGSRLRVDWINPIGPTNAWLALATVTLVRNPQLYIDTGAFESSRRLYRIVPVP